MTIFAEKSYTPKKSTALEKYEHNTRLLYKLKLERDMLEGIVMRMGLIIDALSTSETPQDMV